MKTDLVKAGNGEVVLMFWCQGCETHHAPIVESPDGRRRWTWDGNRERPTIEPSVLVRSGHYMPEHKAGDPCWCSYNEQHPDAPAKFTCGVCHSFVRNGRIEFLSDCSHKFAGRTVDLEDLP